MVKYTDLLDEISGFQEYARLHLYAHNNLFNPNLFAFRGAACNLRIATELSEC